jgi:hydrogenase maturation protease
MSPMGDILIAGVGNELLSDDGAGLQAVRELRNAPMPGVTLIEIGTAILHGLSFVESAARVLVIDAVRGGHPPGTVYLFDIPPEGPGRTVSSLHAMGLREAARLLLPGSPVPAMTVLGVEPASLDYGMSLSKPVREALPKLVVLAKELAARWTTDQAAETAGQRLSGNAGAGRARLLTNTEATFFSEISNGKLEHPEGQDPGWAGASPYPAGCSQTGSQATPETSFNLPTQDPI